MYLEQYFLCTFVLCTDNRLLRQKGFCDIETREFWSKTDRVNLFQTVFRPGENGFCCDTQLKIGGRMLLVESMWDVWWHFRNLSRLGNLKDVYLMREYEFGERAFSQVLGHKNNWDSRKIVEKLGKTFFWGCILQSCDFLDSDKWCQSLFFSGRKIFKKLFYRLGLTNSRVHLWKCWLSFFALHLLRKLLDWTHSIREVLTFAIRLDSCFFE